MANVQLSWTDLNSGSINETEFRIYRSTATFDSDTLPAVLATVAADAVEFTDTTAVVDLVYYYMIEAVGSGVSAFSVLATITLGSGGGAATGEYQVVIPSGKVTTDLTDFPLIIDLSDMPASFWTTVQADGGNVRAYAADGVTVIPHDLTYLNVDRQVGRLIVKTTLLTASANTVVVKTITSPATALLAADPNGRNGVWADYSVVWVFPEEVNRTGLGYAQDMTNLEPETDWVRFGYHQLAGNPHQGIATDNAGIFVSIGTDYLRKYTATDFTSVVASNATPIADTGIATVDHLGDGCIVGTEFFVVLEKYPSGPYVNQHIAVFNLSDLTFNRSYDISAQAHEVSSVCYDGTNLFITDYTDATQIHKYTLTGGYVSSITLSTAITKMQGIEVMNGKFIISSGEATGKPIYEVEFDGTVNGVIYNDPHAANNEGICYAPSTGGLYRLGGNGALVVLHNEDTYLGSRKIHYAPVSVTLPRSTVWTGSAKLFWTVSDGDLQQAFVSLANGESDSNRASLMFDDGPDRLDTWNSGDRWLAPSPGVNPTGYSDLSVGYGHNGTTERKLWANGIMQKADAGCYARPAGAGTDMDFAINSGTAGGDETGEGYYQMVWLREDYLTDSWMAADHANFSAPASFYNPITEV